MSADNSKSIRPWDILLLLKDSLSIEDDKLKIFMQIFGVVPPLKVWTFQHLTQFSHWLLKRFLSYLAYMYQAVSYYRVWVSGLGVS